MTREEYIKRLIKEKGLTVKEFAKIIDIPYTTLLSMLKGLGGAAVDSVIKICQGLGITINDLQQCNVVENTPLTKHQQRVIEAYIAHPEMQQAINTLLGIVDTQAQNNSNCEIAEDMAVFTKAVQSANLRTKQK